jgi:hypothetical protein
MRSAQTAIPGNRKDNRAFSRNRASIGAVRTYLVSGDCGPQRPRLVEFAMSSPEIGAVWGVFIGPLSPRSRPRCVSTRRCGLGRKSPLGVHELISSSERRESATIGRTRGTPASQAEAPKQPFALYGVWR